MFLCQTQVALTKMVFWFSIVIIVTVTITKFMFICVWKSMRTMNDNLMVRIAINQALLSSIVIGLLKFRPHVSTILMRMFLYNIVLLGFYLTYCSYNHYIQHFFRFLHYQSLGQNSNSECSETVRAPIFKIVIFSLQPICTGINDKNEKDLHQSTIFLANIFAIMVGACFFIVSGLAIAVFIGKRKMVIKSHRVPPPKNLESQVINITVIGLLIVSILCNRLYWDG